MSNLDNTNIKLKELFPNNIIIFSPDNAKYLNERLKSIYKFEDINRKSVIRIKTRITKIITDIKTKEKINNNNSRNIRKLSKFYQDIYLEEVSKIIKYLIQNIDKFESFTSILKYIVKKRKIIEILKLNFEWDKYGKVRLQNGKPNNNVQFISQLSKCKANHLIEELQEKLEKAKLEKKNQNKIILSDYNGINLTSYNDLGVFKYRWIHTKVKYIYTLLLKLNKLYDRFITSNVKSKRLLSKLYWVYMQICPFERGSASIGEIIFSALLQKYFGCNFKIYEEEEVKPEIIPDIHALSYDLKKFQDIFWERFTTCPINNRNNNNQHSNVPTNFFDN